MELLPLYNANATVANVTDTITVFIFSIYIFEKYTSSAHYLQSIVSSNVNNVMGNVTKFLPLQSLVRNYKEKKMKEEE